MLLADGTQGHNKDDLKNTEVTQISSLNTRKKFFRPSQFDNM